MSSMKIGLRLFFYCCRFLLSFGAFLSALMTAIAYDRGSFSFSFFGWLSKVTSIELALKFGGAIVLVAAFVGLKQLKRIQGID